MVRPRAHRMARWYRGAVFSPHLHAYGKQGMLSDVREILSRTKAVADVTLDTVVAPGPPVPITGSARASWGPPPPPGTPPARAPNASHPGHGPTGG